MHPTDQPIDPTAADSAARRLFSEHGIGAIMEAERRIIKANAEGDASQADFWQQVARLLQSPWHPMYPNL